MVHTGPGPSALPQDVAPDERSQHPGGSCELNLNLSHYMPRAIEGSEKEGRIETEARDARRD